MPFKNLQDLPPIFFSLAPPQRSSLLQRVDDRVLLLDDRRRLRDVAPEHVALEEVRDHDGELVGDELLGRDGEDLCETS